MTPIFSLRRRMGAPCVVLAALLAAGCATSRSAGVPFQSGDAGAMARAQADSARYPYTQADIDFMSGMIHHHAQAITISRWAETHGASPAVQRLTARIINAQSDEIRLMQNWLKDRNQEPMQVDSAGRVSMSGTDPHAGHQMADMPGMAGMPGMSSAGGMADMADMPGMLTNEQLATLNAARGEAFDELFLNYMIQHHRGAVTMVSTLFSAYGAGQDETIFKFAADVEVDQSTEIRRMLTMLLEMGAPPPPL